MNFIDTHAHLDGEEFAADLPEVVARAKEAGAKAVFVPAIDLQSSLRIPTICAAYPGFLFSMAGLHPEEVKADWAEQLRLIKPCLNGGAIAIGEVGLDYYWSREYEAEQLSAFEEQVEWSVATRLPLMIHCRKAQNEMVRLLRRYERELPGGVFHCFTGNEHEALELLQFDRFVLGVGGVSTFKKSHLPEVLPSVVPLDRLVLETDSPYMAPTPMRGNRNEPAYVAYVVEKLAEAYGTTPDELGEATSRNAERMFGITLSQADDSQAMPVTTQSPSQVTVL